MALDNDDIRRLHSIYLEAEKKIENQIKKLDPKKPFTTNRKNLLSNIKEIERDLLEQSQEWTEETVEKNYKSGSNGVVREMKNAGEKQININFSSADKLTVNSLIADVNLTFANTMQGITRTGMTFLDDFRKQNIINSIASDIAAGVGPQTIKRGIEEEIRASGITAFTDRGGRKVQLSKYSAMLARTTVMRARNDGARLRLLQNGQRFAKVSRHADIDGWDICNEYEGKIVDITDPAIPLPPYHPNCRHILQFVRPTDLKKKAGTATTIKQAEKFAEQYADKVTYSGISVSTANTLNRTFEDQFKNFNIRKLNVITTSKQTNKASMLFGGGELRVNTAMFANNARLLKQETLNQTLMSPAQKSIELSSLKPIRSQWRAAFKTAETEGAKKFTKSNFDYFDKQIKDLESQSSRFTYNKGEFDIVPSVLRHELGHVLSIQNPKIREEALKLFGKVDLKKLSEYSKFNGDEMIAESFSAFAVKDYGVIPPEMRKILNKLD